MKKFWAVCFVAFLFFSVQAQAECYVGMVVAKYANEKDYHPNVSYPITSVRGLVCSSCSGGTCTKWNWVSNGPTDSCKRFNLSANKCEQCDDGYESRFGDCYCNYSKGRYQVQNPPLNNYSNGVHRACRLCSADFTIAGGICLKCSTRDPYHSWIKWNCDDWTCNSGYYRTDKGNGYCKPCSSISVSNGTCTACAADGSACTSATCSAGYAWNGSGCARLSCSAGQYVKGNSCAACPSGTWSSGGTATSCQSCSNLSVANGTCTGCSASGNCTAVSCNGGYKASGASCVQATCPAGQYVRGNSCAACPSGTWSNGGTATSCQSCSSISVSNGTCTACTTTGSCSEFVCSDGYALKNGFCVVKKCVSGTYEDASGNCRPCSDIAVAGGECTSCSYDGSVCESVRCAEGWTNASVTSCTATKNCSAGGFWDEESQSCKRCDTYMIANGGCVECDAKACSKAECDKPDMTFNSSAQKCGVECAANQYLDASLECQTCEKGQYAAGGWSAEATSCTSCSTIAVEGGTCVECSNAECLKASCGDGWRLDESGKKCLKNAANCLDGLSVTADGCCCAK